MKRNSFRAVVLVFGLLPLLVSCGGRAVSETQTTYSEYEVEGDATEGTQRQKTYDFSDTLTAGGRLYHYAIHREADESLPCVVNDEGTSFADNRYTLTIQSEGQTCFERQFTKSDFASYLSRDFRENGLLDGMMCDRTLPGLVFAVSVTLPQSDMVEPLLLRIYPGEGISIAVDTRSDNDFEEQQ